MEKAGPLPMTDSVVYAPGPGASDVSLVVGRLLKDTDLPFLVGSGLYAPGPGEVDAMLEVGRPLRENPTLLGAKLRSYEPGPGPPSIFEGLLFPVIENEEPLPIVEGAV